MITRLLGRPREFDETTALTRAIEVFWWRGFEATSVNDVADATGVKKGSLYVAFGDKITLYSKALGLYLDRLIDSIAARFETAGEFADQLEGLLGSFLEMVVAGDRRGCFLCNASTDVAATNEEVSRVVQKGLRRLERAFFDGLGTRFDAPTRQRRAKHLVATYLGLQTLAKAGYPAASLRAIVDLALEPYRLSGTRH